jgi:hypothetical protein
MLFNIRIYLHHPYIYLSDNADSQSEPCLKFLQEAETASDSNVFNKGHSVSSELEYNSEVV